MLGFEPPKSSSPPRVNIIHARLPSHSLFAILTALAFSLTSTYDAMGDDILCKAAATGTAIMIAASIVLIFFLPFWEKKAGSVPFWIIVWCAYWGGPLIGFALQEIWLPFNDQIRPTWIHIVADCSARTVP
ncbi:hypothetical protein DL96DRAFT_1623120 [Flagelloscypha sp. PMI_526]|nr:hypothetical protein DL96DRAFT_1623120 [Flagelloscypha sp. PMI_526]